MLAKPVVLVGLQTGEFGVFYCRRVFSFTFFASSWVLITTAQAQQAANVEEIHVLGYQTTQNNLSLNQPSSTSSRLGISLLDTPASVSVISQEDIAAKSDFSTLSATTRAAGIAASASPGNGGSALTARGFRGNKAVMTQYDGNRIFTASGTVSFPSDTWTIARIEVLRGANSVINGVGSIGATVNYISKKPTFSAINSEAMLAYGSDNLQRYAVGSGGQINEVAAFRIDAAHYTTDGYINGNKQQRSVLANSYLVKAADNVDILFAFDYAKRRDDRTYYGTPLVNGKIAAGTRKNNYNVDDAYMEFEDFWPRINLTWRISENIEWHSNVNYLHSDRTWLNVEDFQYKNSTQQVDLNWHLGIRHKQKQLGTSHDVLMQFAFAEHISNRLNIGFEVNDLRFNHYGDYYAPGFVETPSSTGLLNPTPGSYYDHASGSIEKGMENSALQYAVFADNVVSFNERVFFLLGIRRDAIDFERKNVVRTGPDYDGKLYTTSWRTGLVYKPVNNLSLYAQYNHSVEAMGALLTLSQDNLKQEPMTGKQYELGLKHDVLNGKLQYSLALFNITKNNLLSTDPDNPTLKQQIGEQRSRGIEFEAFWQAASFLTASINGAYTQAEYTEFRTASDDYSGKTPTLVPTQTANAWLTWAISEPVSLATGARYVGERYLDRDNNDTLPSYVVYDASLTWQATKALRVGLHGKNLNNNERYVLSGNSYSWLMADGRTYELSLHLQF